MVHRAGALLVGAAALVGTAVVGLPGTVTAATGGSLCQLAGTANFTPPLTGTAGNFTYNFAGALSGCQSNDSTSPASGTVEAGKTVTNAYSWTYNDSTTLAAAASAGAATITTTASEAAVATQVGNTVVQIDPGTSVAETRTVTAVSGTGPFTETLSSPLSFSHLAGAGVTGTHSGTANATYQEPVPTGNGSCSNSTTSGVAISNWADGTTTVESYTTSGAAAAVNLSGSVVPSVTDTLLSFTGPTQAPPASTFTVSTTRYAGDSAQGVLLFQPPDPTLCASTGVTTAAISGQVGVGSAS